ncbi:MAG: restriction endonuclease [Pseudomonadota bacterium]
MARRRNDSTLALIANAPWWVGLVVAGIIYLGLRFVVLSLASSSPFLQGLAQSAPKLAWFLALPFVLAAAVAAARQYFRRRLLETQKDIDSLRDLSWQEFELLVSAAFRRHGYAVEERGGSGPDGGIDLVIRKAGRTAVVQCKRWKQKQVGVTLVRELYGVMVSEGADEALFVSSGDYTADARGFADGKPIRLIDGQALLEMVRAVQQKPVKPVAVNVEARPEPVASAQETPSCPRCGSEMVQRTAKTGKNAGQAFWGCSGFPTCRGTLPIN